MADTPETPKVFISYSWTSDDHKAFVLDLATRLQTNGVHVVIDIWDLRGGDDVFAFMEQMVLNTEIDRVLVVCDRVYAERADDRKGGVGTETQIISPAVYEQIDSKDRPQRFIPVVTELDEEGRPFRPAYLKNRKYIDLSHDEWHQNQFEELVREIFGKPQLVRPQLGKAPHYIDDDSIRDNEVAADLHRRAMADLRDGRSQAAAGTADWLDACVAWLPSTAEPLDPKDSVDDRVLAAINDQLSARDKLIDLALASSRYLTDDLLLANVFRRFFEHTIPLSFFERETEIAHIKGQFDNFRFWNYEAFLYVAAAFLKGERFSAFATLVGDLFFVGENNFLGGDASCTYSMLNEYMPSVDRSNKVHNWRKLSPVGHLVRERATRTDIDFERLMQADFVLWLRDDGHWHPWTLVYTGRYRTSGFEIFERAASKHYFEKIVPVIRHNSPKEIRSRIESAIRHRDLPVWQGDALPASVLANLDRLATREGAASTP